jgi:hypothetical protein
MAAAVYAEKGPRDNLLQGLGPQLAELLQYCILAGGGLSFRHRAKVALGQENWDIHWQ